jgi:signal peptidase II
MVKIVKKHIFSIILITSIFLLDRISKIIILNLETIYGTNSYSLTSFINFELIWNDGIAFGLLSLDNEFYYNLVTLFIIIVTLVVFFIMTKSIGSEKYGFMMVFGGSLGNIFDRLYYSSVPDFIDIHFNNFHWFIFNVADIFITLGLFLLIYLEIFCKKKI